MEYKDTIKITGLIKAVLKDANGKIKGIREVKNTITNVSFAVFAGLAGAVDTQTAFTYLALGTGTTAAAATDTALETEITDSGLARAGATVTRETTTLTNDTLQLDYTWTASGSKAVTEAGALNAASVGVLAGRQVFTALAAESSDTIQITYKFKFS